MTFVIKLDAQREKLEPERAQCRIFKINNESEGDAERSYKCFSSWQTDALLETAKETGWMRGREHAEKRRRWGAEEQKEKGEEQRVSSVWAERAGEVRVMTGTHAGLYLPDVWSVHTVLSSAPISFLSHYVLDPTLHQSLFLTHSLPLFLPITGPWKKK